MELRLWFAFLTLIPLICFAMNEEKAIDTLLSDFARPQSPGAAVIVIKNEKPVFCKAYGLANLEKHTPCATNTNFRLASVTKQFTAMAIMILAERGSLSLEDKMTNFFPEFPDYGRVITIRHLLIHASGLLDYEEVMPANITIPLSDRDVLYILRHQNKLEFPAGRQFHYSNSGYSLLSLIVEAASGQKFAAFLAQNIFLPLGMNRSVAYEPGISVVLNRALGYAKTKDGFEFSDQSSTSAVLGDGGIYSSVTDLHQWDQALYTGRLVSQQMLEQAFTIHSASSDFEKNGYGFGWYLGEYRHTKHLWHYGSTCGFSTQIERFPEKKLSVILLTNRSDAKIKEFPQKIADLYWR